MSLEDLEVGAFEEPEEENERQNRTFIILVALMSGLLLVGVVAFCVWVLFAARGAFPGFGTAQATPTAVMEVAAATPVPSPSPTPVPPTATPSPASTPTPRPTATPRARPTPAAVAEETPTVVPRQVMTPTPTTVGEAPNAIAQTGMGSYTALLVGAGLLALLFAVRRLRAAH